MPFFGKVNRYFEQINENLTVVSTNESKGKKKRKENMSITIVVFLDGCLYKI